VQLGRDLTLTMTITADAGLDAQFPAIADRLRGLGLDGQYDGDSSAANGKTVRVRYFQLKPALAEEYRIAPMAVMYNGGWLGTPPIKLPAKRLADTNSGGVGDILAPVWIRPPFKTVALWFLYALAAAAAVAGLWKLLHRVRRQIQLMRMSPRERALHELSALLERNLPGKRLVKDFYFELTMIVRRYIERAHKVRAPEQTTEEFLGAVSSDARFNREVITRLKTFLEAADLVKFAAYQPDKTSIQRATDTARGYVETDAADQDAAAAAREGGKS